MSNNKSESLKNGWLKLRFEQIAENIVDHVEIPRESGFERFVGGDHLESECLRIKRWGSTNDVDAQKLLFKKGHILFGKRNAYLRKVAYSDFDGVCSAHMMVLESKPEFIEERFFPFFMQTDQFWERADMISEGSMSPTIKWKTLAKQEFIIPPKEDQRCIADILWAAEDYIVKKETLVAETEIYQKILMKDLLTKGIGHKKFKNTEIGKIPEEWNEVNLGDICEKIKSGGTPLTSNKEYYGGDIKFVKIEDLTNSKKYLTYTLIRITEKGLENSNAWIIPENSVLIAIYASLGATAINNVKVATNQAILGIIPDKKILSEEFLYYFFLNSKNLFLRQARHTTQANLSLEIIENLKMPLPPLPEQRHIGEILSKVDYSIQKTQENINKTKALKMMLINQFLNCGLGAKISINPQTKHLYKTQVSE